MLTVEVAQGPFQIQPTNKPARASQPKQSVSQPAATPPVSHSKLTSQPPGQPAGRPAKDGCGQLVEKPSHQVPGGPAVLGGWLDGPSGLAGWLASCPPDPTLDPIFRSNFYVFLILQFLTVNYGSKIGSTNWIMACQRSNFLKRAIQFPIQCFDPLFWRYVRSKTAKKNDQEIGSRIGS